MKDADEATGRSLRLHAEELVIDKRTVETGRVRVSLTTASQERRIEEELARSDVVVERIRIDRAIETMPQTRQEGDTTIIPIVEEIVVVERRLMLAEEVRITRTHSTTRHAETVTLRTQQVAVERLPPVADPHVVRP